MPDRVPEVFREFVRESNRIEGIHRDPLQSELVAHSNFLAFPTLTVAALEVFVGEIQPGAALRSEPHMDVRVGNHIPPPGGSSVVADVYRIIDSANGGADPYEIHCQYETLHPFMDGNGRSGRVIWLWQMIRQHGAHHALRMGFLHLFYYQTLSHLPLRQPTTTEPEHAHG